MRNMLRQKFYSIINIFGLSIGIAATILITLYISDEWSYDRFHTDAERIYRVGIDGILSGQEIKASSSPSPMAATLVEELPEVEAATRIDLFTEIVTRYEDKIFSEPNLLLADSNFFDFFTFEVVAGDAGEALKGPNKIVLTESTAKKYFGYSGTGDSSPLGKTLTLFTTNVECVVTGIIKDPPQNSHFLFTMILSLESTPRGRSTQWTNNSIYTYFKLREGHDILATQDKFDDLVEKYVGPEIEQFLGFNLETFRAQGGEYGYVLEPMLDIHLKSQFTDGPQPGGNITYLYIFSAIAVFIIFIACINFMNLSTARSANRAKEVGIRKTVGALRQRLVGQFMAESVLFSIISMLLAILWIYLSIAPFNQIAAKAIVFDPFGNIVLLPTMLSVALIVGILAGSYPALYLTSFKPAEVLKGKIRAGFRSSGIRSFLVVFQFTISICLIICTTLVYQQLSHIQNKNLGFDKENVVVIDNSRSLGSNQNAFIETIKSYQEVVSVSSSNMLPPAIYNNSVFRPVGEPEDQLINYYTADFDHLETMEYEMAAGRFFSEDFPSDSNAVVINESAMRQIGWDNYDGKQIYAFFNSMDDPPVNVIGVIRDFNYESLKNEIKPLAIFLRPNNQLTSVRLTAGNTAEKIEFLESKWKEFAPNSPFSFTFLDQNFDALFKAEQQLGKVFLIFTVLAIAIACLGLFGLAAFTAEQRAKEISIRKVMGASASGITVLLSRDFTKLVLISFIISAPISYFTMDWWLSSFAYKINIGVLTFILSGVLAMVISWLTVGYQSIKAALGNPVTALRNE